MGDSIWSASDGGHHGPPLTHLFVSGGWNVPSLLDGHSLSSSSVGDELFQAEETVSVLVSRLEHLDSLGHSGSHLFLVSEHSGELGLVLSFLLSGEFSLSGSVFGHELLKLLFVSLCHLE